jgi:uncharacterized protein YyaL (SSP411 family)
MGWGPLYDEKDGGFFRYARRADWGEPNDEKLLDVNASMLDLYVDAAETLELERYLERAADILRYVQSWLADQVDGGWAGSQRADPAYHAAEGGHGPDAPPIDRTLYTDWNAMMASASALFSAAALWPPTGISGSRNARTAVSSASEGLSEKCTPKGLPTTGRTRLGFIWEVGSDAISIEIRGIAAETLLSLAATAIDICNVQPAIA